MKTRYLLLLLLVASSGYAQPDKPIIDPSNKSVDTLTLTEAFRKGSVSGDFRYFFMATNNQQGLSDYYANAVGVDMKYESAPFKKLQLGISGFFIYNVGSSDLSRIDSQTHQFNRYELGLFDLEDPKNKKDINQLEELYIKYKSARSEIVFGKQLINTPFINPQDSRMRPTAMDGVYGYVTVSNRWNLEGGWLYKISPRSTVKWYSVAHSIGVNSQGVNIDGTSANYKGNLHSKGVGLLGAIFKPISGLQLRVYNQFAENLFNTAFFQADYKKVVGRGAAKAALQYIRQDALNGGGNTDPSKTYFDKSNKVNVFGARVGWEQPYWKATLNYTRITKSGRFIMPREWGTEPFFTYLSRERNEGAGNINAIMAKVKGKLPHTKLDLELGYGQYYLPNIENARLNKYKMPSYNHFKVMADYDFENDLEGLNLTFLFVYKGKLGNDALDHKYLINKVNMTSFNIIMHYHF